MLLSTLTSYCQIGILVPGSDFTCMLRIFIGGCALQDDNLLNLGAWTGDDFSQTLSQSGFVGVDSGLPDELRFRCNMTKLVARLFPNDDIAHQDMLPAIFVFSPSPPEEATSFNPKREPMLNNGLVPIDGRVWFVGPTANRKGSQQEFNVIGMDEEIGRNEMQFT